RYMYSLGNPLRFSDPSGHCALNANGDPDTVGDYDCWQLAYGIYGFGLTEQSFADDWRVSPDEWLKNIAGTSYATVDSLKPFYDKYDREFRGRTGLHSADSLNPVTNPEIELPGPLQHVAESVVYSAIDCARDAPLGCSKTLDDLALVAAGGGMVLCAAATGGGCLAIAGGLSTAAGGTSTLITIINYANGERGATATDVTVGIITTATGWRWGGQAKGAVGTGTGVLQWVYDEWTAANR
ncbi:hypothetical protein KC887_06490, partial [Candidatus Kaiserbacteria bacterium]|nr:hypothetical protein [Candidatus Kaiserbacteria bacterium]